MAPSPYGSGAYCGRQVALALLLGLIGACGEDTSVSAVPPDMRVFDQRLVASALLAELRENAVDGPLSEVSLASQLGEPVLDALRQLVRADPTRNASLHALADELFGASRFEEARGVLALRLEFVPEDAESHVLLAWTHCELGQHEEEARTLARALELEPTRLHWRLMRLEALFDSHQHAEALELYEELLVDGFEAFEQPGRRSTFASWPRIYGPTYKFEARAHEQGGRAALLLGRAEKARDSFEAALRVESDRLEATAGLAGARLQLGLDAEAALQRTRELEPEHAECESALAGELLEAGLPAEALRACQLALALDPELASALLHQGRAHLQLGQRVEALAALERALALREDFPEAHYHHGLVLEALSSPEEARAAYRRALELAPDLPGPRERLTALDAH